MPFSLTYSSKEPSKLVRVRARPDVAAERLANRSHRDRTDSSLDSWWPAGGPRGERHATSNVGQEPSAGRGSDRATPPPLARSVDPAEVRFSAMSVAVGVAFLFLCKPSADDQGQKWKLRA